MLFCVYVEIELNEVDESIWGRNMRYGFIDSDVNKYKNKLSRDVWFSLRQNLICVDYAPHNEFSYTIISHEIDEYGVEYEIDESLKNVKCNNIQKNDILGIGVESKNK